MGSSKFEIEKFDRFTNFALWKLKMNAILVENGLDEVMVGIKKKPADMEERDFLKLDKKTLTLIQLVFLMRC